MTNVNETIEIYGACYADRELIDCDGEMDVNELRRISDAELTWEGIGLPAEDCNFVVITNGNTLEFDELEGFQDWLKTL